MSRDLKTIFESSFIPSALITYGSKKVVVKQSIEPSQRILTNWVIAKNEG